MGLSATISAGVIKAFETVGDVKKTITYHSVSIGVFDPTLDTRADTVTDYSVDVIETTIKQAEQDWTPVVRDSKKILIPAANLAVTPNENDYVTLDGLTWEIIKINGVPGGSLHILFIRQP